MGQLNTNHFSLEKVLSFTTILNEANSFEQLEGVITEYLQSLIKFDQHILLWSENNEPIGQLFKNKSVKSTIIFNGSVENYLKETLSKKQNIDELKAQFPKLSKFLDTKDIETSQVMASTLFYKKTPRGLLLLISKTPNSFKESFLRPIEIISKGISSVLQKNTLQNETLTKKKIAETLLSINKDITSTRNRHDLYKIIIEKIRLYIQFDDAVVIALTKDGRCYNHMLTASPEQRKSNQHYSEVVDVDLPLENSPVQHFLDEPNLSHWQLKDYLVKYPEYPGFVLMSETNLNNSLNIKLKYAGEVIGLLIFHFTHQFSFDKTNIELYKVIGDLVGLALNNILANEKIIREKSQKEALLSISESITQVRDKKGLMEVIIERMQPVFDFDDAVINLWADNKQSFVMIASDISTGSSELPEYKFFNDGLINIEEAGPYKEIVEMTEPTFNSLNYWLNKYPDFPGMGIMKKQGFIEHLVLPLYVENDRIGVLEFHSTQEGKLKSQDMDLFKGAADQVAVAASNILANEEILVRQKEKETLLSISEDISTIRDKNDLLSIINDKLRVIFNFDYTVVAIKVNEEKHMQWINDSDEELESKDNYHKIVNKELVTKGSPFEWLFSYDKIDYVNGDDINARYPDYPGTQLYQEMGLKQSVVMPLRYGGHFMGTMLLHSKDPDYYQTINLNILNNAANQMAVAVSNILANEEIKGQNIEQSLKIAVSNAITQAGIDEERYLAFVKVLQTYLPFDLFILEIIDQKSSDTLTYRYESTGYDEFRVLDAQQFCTILGMDKKNFESFQSIPNTTTSALYGDTEFDSLAKGEQYFRALAYTFNFRCYLTHGFLFDDKNRKLQLHLFSRQAEIYLSHHLEVLQKVSPTLQLSFEKLFAQKEIVRLSEQLREEKQYLQEEVNTTYNFEEMVGESEEIQEVFAKVREIAPLDNTVLLLGETGTGKELIARAIHNNSSRRDRVLVKVNCAAIPSQIVESELFGHEKGAFTGALKQRVGKFELAHKGTIFLDEIGEMPLELQSKLLRVLQEREVERVGSNEIIKLDFRVIAATNRNLEEEIRKGNFRADLYYRINTFPMNLPPLRSRGEDTLLLADYFARQSSQKLGLPFKGFTQKTKDRFMEYNWPGNVREMQSLIEQAIITQKGKVLEVVVNKPNIPMLDSYNSSTQDNVFKLPENGDFDMDYVKKQRDALEKQYIQTMLEKTKWRVSGKGGAAQKLGVAPSTLESRMRKLGIQRSE